MAKRLEFTKKNFLKTIEGAKWQTRRLHDRPRYQVGDIAALCEPTQVTEIREDKFLNFNADVYYPWGNVSEMMPISGASYQKLVYRKNWSREAIARFMLDDFARYWVEITEVREEPLQNISEEDAIAEGVERDGDFWKCYGNCLSHAEGYDKRTSAKASFMTLWNSIHSAQERRWDANPTVIVYSYKLMEP